MSISRPNIVFIMADQLAAGFLGCYGSGVDSTPTLDGLAREGVRFDRCYATHPVCAPNRATVLTGRSSCVHGIVSNNYALATDMPTYAHVLQEHGYRTGGFGKFHQTPMHMPTPGDLSFLGFDESLVTEDPKWPWLEWVEREHPEFAEEALSMCWPFWPSHPRSEKSDLCVEASKKILGPLRAASEWRMMYPSPLPPEVHDTTYITNLGIDFMERHLIEHKDQPFFCHVSYVDPHDPYDPPEPYASMFEPDDMPDPIPAEWLTEGFKALERSQDFHQFGQIFHKPQVMRKLRAFYHGSLRFMDDQIARVVDLIKERGLWENTILVFTTDHGDMMGDHGLITKGVKHYDKGIRCPLIVAGGNVRKSVTDKLACTLDFFPTFCDWAGVDTNIRPPLEGKSFAGICVGREEENLWQEVSVAIGRAESVITDDGWRLTRFLGEDKGQMFNLNDDPDEQNNLYYTHDHGKKRQELMERLVKAMSWPRLVPHYRNMPLVDGKKIPIYSDQIVEGLPLYRGKRSPVL